ncbi:MAG TPA: alginate lyase family protein [Tepidisphaeraceae bacterium]|nr:alginate lyase family protein [Tepidisphaeraceae bacterium]
MPKLWTYNLHYFDYLWALDYSDALTLMSDWIERCTLNRVPVAWESYPISLRLMNWCGVFFARFREELQSDIASSSRLFSSIAQQADWLESHIETHLMGNHLLENAAALATVGACFAGPHAARWFENGLSLLREQLDEQVLPDGGHFERSPMYHSRLVYLLAMLGNIGDSRIDEIVEGPLAKSRNVQSMLSHPDGQLALLNDSGLGIYNESAEVTKFLGVSSDNPVGPFALPDSGYFGACTDDNHYIVCDAGLLGPDYQPGHSHGDMLSFELSLGGHRAIIDSGTYDYNSGSMRDYCRSTRAHNTVEVDGQDQAEFWDVFRVARRGKIRQAEFAPMGDGFALIASHDGYRILDRGPIHRRRFRWWNRGILEVKDTLCGSRRHQFVSRLHLHPECSIEELAADRVRLKFAGGTFSVCFHGPGQLSIEDSFYCPTFGCCIANQAIAFSGEFHREIEFGFRVIYAP